MMTWRRLNPTFRYEFWDNARCAAFGFRNADKINQMPELCGKADLMRYEILAAYGGIYIDADAECIRPLDDGFLEHDSWCAFENETARPGLLANGYLGASRGNRLMQACVDECSRRDMRAGRAWEITGTCLFTLVAKMHPELRVYPSWMFMPEHFDGLKYDGPGPVYARQYWGSTLDLYGALAPG